MNRTLAYAAVIVLIGTATARATTLTFGEIPFQPVDGLSFRGVTFDFKIGGLNSGDAFYNSYGPGTLTTVDDPSLTGRSTGILTLDFDVATAILRFGAVLNSGDPLSPGFAVELFDADLQSLGTTAVDTLPAGGALGFSEALFEYSGTPVGRAVIDFADDPGNFAIDNLVFVPEPSTRCLWLLASTLILPPLCRRPVLSKKSSGVKG
jgi:hypothetical protein